VRLAQLVLTSQFWPFGTNRVHFRKPLPVCCHHGGKRLESTSPMWNSRNTSKNPDRRTGNRSKIPRLIMIYNWQTVENDRTNITRPISVIIDHVSGHIESLWRVLWKYSNCARLLQLIPDTIICGGSKLEVVFPRGSPPCFLVGFWLSETGPVDYSQFPRLRQQTEVDTLRTFVSRRLDFLIDSDWPWRVQCG